MKVVEMNYESGHVCHDSQMSWDAFQSDFITNLTMKKLYPASTPANSDAWNSLTSYGKTMRNLSYLITFVDSIFSAEGNALFLSCPEFPH